jgi:hypothetical protein
MSHQSYTSEQEKSLLIGVREGMPVYDSDDRKVGMVKYVQFPNESGDADAQGAYLPNVPGDIRARLLSEGFVQTEGGLFSPDRYIMPHQILDVRDDHLRLNVLKDALIKF